MWLWLWSCHVTDVWQCDSDVMLTLTLSLKNKNKINKMKITNEKIKNKIVRVYHLELWQVWWKYDTEKKVEDFNNQYYIYNIVIIY